MATETKITIMKITQNYINTAFVSFLLFCYSQLSKFGTVCSSRFVSLNLINCTYLSFSNSKIDKAICVMKKVSPFSKALIELNLYLDNKLVIFRQ